MAVYMYENAVIQGGPWKAYKLKEPVIVDQNEI